MLISLRLTLFVLVCLLLSLFVGMFWDQTLTLDEHLANIAPGSTGAFVFGFLELNDVFHSWWFSLLILLLALNLIACTFERLGGIWLDIHHPPWPLTDKRLRTATHKLRVETNDAEGLKALLMAQFPKAKLQTVGQEAHYFIEKHRYARCGVYVVHIALLMIMFGSIAATNLGVDGMMVIPEATRAHIARIKGPGGVPFEYDLGMDVFCQDFRLRTFSDGSPMAYESDLVIFDPKGSAQPAARKTIRLNDPLHYKGYTFYQSSYQPLESESLVRLMVAPHNGAKLPVELALGQSHKLDATTHIIATDVHPDYAGLGEAVKVQQITQGEAPTTFLVFRQYPEFDPLVRRGNWDIYFMGTDQKFATGISVGKVPGVSVVFVGFLVMFVGLYMAFCMSHRRICVRMRALSDTSAEVVLAGFARRHLYAFADEWKRLISSLKLGS